jgi:hypothetical protein
MGRSDFEGNSETSDISGIGAEDMWWRMKRLLFREYATMFDKEGQKKTE